MEDKLRIVAIIQARMGSSRLPGKVLKKIGGKSVIEILLSRLARSKLLTSTIVATSLKQENDLLCEELQRLGCPVYRGEEHNVLKRYYYAALQEKADIVVRITGDCPLVEAYVVDTAISLHLETRADYTSNGIPPTFPDGLDVEVFSISMLKTAYYEAKSSHEKEHVTPYMRNGKFKTENFINEVDLSHHRLTLDENNDLKIFQKIFEKFKPDIFFDYWEAVNFLDDNPSIKSINQSIIRNEGENMSDAQKLWKRAKDVIPGGNGLFSKRPALFSPNSWPTYYSSASGINIKDISGKEYKDFMMAVGANTLGYCDTYVNEKVSEAVKCSTMTTLNNPTEIFLAEKLIELHEWAECVKFARTGGEANAVAIRIARASTGRDKIAFCGYHGWHDWYLSANLKKDSLGQHLMKGLPPTGVPDNLKDSSFTFNYNDFAAVETLVAQNKLAAIIMEVERTTPPKNNFLQKVRDLCTQNGIVLIFDECTSGFRKSFGGLHLLHGVNPDIAMFGKALGNGFGINAVIGKRSIMESAQRTFISSTNWTESVGPTAGLATLQKMEEIKSWEILIENAKFYRKIIESVAKEANLEVKFSGIEPLTVHEFVSEYLNSENYPELKTFITQEFLKRGYISTNLFYACVHHKKEDIEIYGQIYSEILKQATLFLENGASLTEKIIGPVAEGGFQRLA